MSQEVNEFFTIGSLLTFGGATLAVWVISNTFRTLLRRDTPWVPFLVAIVIVFGGALYNQALQNLIDWVIAFLNSCLVFCTATGFNEMAVDVSTKKPAGETVPHGALPVPWLTHWYK